MTGSATDQDDAATTRPADDHRECPAPAPRLQRDVLHVQLGTPRRRKPQKCQIY